MTAVASPETTATTLQLVAPRGAWLDALTACVVTTTSLFNCNNVAITVDDQGALSLATCTGPGKNHTGQASTTVSMPSASSYGNRGTVYTPARPLLSAIRATAKGRSKASLALPVSLSTDADGVTVSLDGVPSAVLPLGTAGADVLASTPSTSTIDTAALAELLQATTYAAATGNVVPGLEAVQLTSDGHELTAHATDRFRLVRSVAPISGTSFTALPSAELVTKMVRLFTDPVTGVGVSDKGATTFTNGFMTVTFERHSDVDYPRLTQMCKGYTAWVDVDRLSLLEAAKFVLATFNAHGTRNEPAVVSIAADGAATLHASWKKDPWDSRELGVGRALVVRGHHGVEASEGFYPERGAALHGLNPHYLHDALEHLQGDAVRMHTSGKGKAVLFESTDPEQRCQAVVMGMRLPLA